MKPLFLLLILIAVFPLAARAQTSVCDAQCIQHLQSALELQTARADNAEALLKETKEQVNVWYNLFLDERKRADLIQSANGDRREVEKYQAAAIMAQREQHALDALAIRDLNQEVRACERGKFKTTVVAFGIGAVTGAIGGRKFSFR